MRAVSRHPRAIVWSAAAAYAVLLTALALKRHHDFHTGYDLAIFDQLTWLLGHGHDPFSTVRGRPMLGDHFQPGVALLAPIGLLSAGPALLLAAQSIALAVTAPLLLALARARGADPLLGIAVALLWLLSPLTQSTNLFDFHPETFVPALLAACALALARDRLFVFALTAAIACSLKEDIPLVFVVWGLVLAVRGHRRFGLGCSAVALAWFALATTVGIEAFGGTLTYYSQRFGGGADTGVGTVLEHLVLHPVAAAQQLLTRLNAKMIAGLVGSTAGFCLLAPELLLLALPPLAANLLSRYQPQHYLTLQYHIVPAGVLAVAAAYGVARLRPPGPRARRAAGVLAPVVAAAFVYLGPVVKVARGNYAPERSKPAAVTDALATALRLVPSGAAISVQYDAVAHVAERRLVYVFPEPFVQASGNGEMWSRTELRRRAARIRFVLVDDGSTFPATETEALEARSQLRRAGFRVVFSRAGVQLLRRDGVQQ